MIGVCSTCRKMFETTLEDAYTPGVTCAACYASDHQPQVDLAAGDLAAVTTYDADGADYPDAEYGGRMGFDECPFCMATNLNQHHGQWNCGDCGAAWADGDYDQEAQNGQ